MEQPILTTKERMGIYQRANPEKYREASRRYYAKQRQAKIDRLQRDENERAVDEGRPPVTIEIRRGRKPRAKPVLPSESESETD